MHVVACPRVFGIALERPVVGINCLLAVGVPVLLDEAVHVCALCLIVL